MTTTAITALIDAAMDEALSETGWFTRDNDEALADLRVLG